MSSQHLSQMRWKIYCIFFNAKWISLTFDSYEHWPHVKLTCSLSQRECFQSNVENANTERQSPVHRTKVIQATRISINANGMMVNSRQNERYRIFIYWLYHKDRCQFNQTQNRKKRYEESQKHFISGVCILLFGFVKRNKKTKRNKIIGMKSEQES